MKKKYVIWFFAAFTFMLTSCLSNKDITYFQGVDKIGADSIGTKFEAIIKPGDILSINVVSLSPEANQFFSFQSDRTQANNANRSSGYLVDIDGNIEIPLVGKVKISGLTISIATDTVRNRLDQFLERPAVSLRHENYRVTILGEVARPGIYTVPNEKITLLEALGLAGDVTIYGKRKNILVIRESNGKREFTRLDLTSKDVFKSPVFYLQSSDVVYVDPGKGKIAMSDNFYRIMPMILSTITVLSVVLVRFI
jgi:polysaccharide export outer membrane protein